MRVLVAPRRLDYKLQTFFIIWIGQIISVLGSGLTSFGLGIWVYQHTSSVTKFAITVLCIALPSLLISPFAGAFVDRKNRRTVMIFCDIGSSICTLAAISFYLTGLLQLWNICVITAVTSILNVVRNLAFTTLVTQLVPKEYFGQASGMMQMGPATAQIFSPLLAGLLLGTIQIKGVLVIDLLTFGFSLLTLLLVSVPNLTPPSEGAVRRGSLLADAVSGWTFIAARPGLLNLLIFFAVFNFNLGFSVVLFTPLLLSIAPVEVVGIVGSVAGSGLLLGSILMGIWGGPKRRIYGILGFGLLVALGLILAGIRPSAPLIAAANFVILFAAPIVNGCSQAIWQSKTPPEIQGRVFALRMMIAWSITPLAYLAAGPLSDKVFEPLLSDRGFLAGSIGQIIGVGKGRGIGLLFIIVGVLAAIVAIAGFLSRRLRLMEDELPDAVASTPP